jgi:methylated-DNA-[protein]-cysteine S-methyltransferase
MSLSSSTLQKVASATWHTILPSAVGDLTIVRDADGLRGLYFPRHWHRPDPSTFGPRRERGFDAVADQLSEYLDGARREFDLPLVLVGDPIHRAVWALLADIGYGDTTTYGALAAQLRTHRDEGLAAITAQQVGAAVGANPLCILVPCHRVVGHDGRLTGYAGGLARKRQLLELEREQVSRTRKLPFQGSLL